MLGLILKLQRNSCWWRTAGFQHWSWYTWAFLFSWTLTLGVLLCRCGFYVLFLFDSHKHCLCIRPWFLLVFICFLLIGPFSIIFLGHVVLWFLLFFFLFETSTVQSKKYPCDTCICAYSELESFSPPVSYCNSPWHVLIFFPSWLRFHLPIHGSS